MSSGQTPRTPVHFPRMKYRAAKRHQRAAFGRDHRCIYISIVPDVAPFRSQVREAMEQIAASATKAAAGFRTIGALLPADPAHKHRKEA